MPGPNRHTPIRLCSLRYEELPRAMPLPVLEPKEKHMLQGDKKRQKRQKNRKGRVGMVYKCSM